MSSKSGPWMVCCLAAWTVAPALAQGTSTQPNPTVVFATPGTKQVSLQVCNTAGCNTAQRSVSVLVATPAILSAGLAPSTVEAGDLVRLAGEATGAPPLSYTWTIFAGQTEVASLPGAVAWWNTTDFPPGAYTAQLTVGNGVGSVSASALAIDVVPPPNRSFFTVTPCRVIDTRNTTPLVSSVVRTIAIAAAGCGIPATARSLSANLSVTLPTGSGLVVLYPGNYPKPETWSLNFSAGQTRTNNIVLALANDGTATINAEASVSGTGGTVHFILDVNGYFE